MAVVDAAICSATSTISHELMDLMTVPAAQHSSSLYLCVSDAHATTIWLSPMGFAAIFQGMPHQAHFMHRQAFSSSVSQCWFDPSDSRTCESHHGIDFAHGSDMGLAAKSGSFPYDP